MSGDDGDATAHGLDELRVVGDRRIATTDVSFLEDLGVKCLRSLRRPQSRSVESLEHPIPLHSLDGFADGHRRDRRICLIQSCHNRPHQIGAEKWPGRVVDDDSIAANMVEAVSYRITPCRTPIYQHRAVPDQPADVGTRSRRDRNYQRSTARVGEGTEGPRDQRPAGERTELLEFGITRSAGATSGATRNNYPRGGGR